MKTLAVACGVSAVLVAICWAGSDSGTPAGKSGKTNSATKLVVDVLQREAHESVADRAELFKPALEQVPNHEAARGLSGFVFDARQKEWLRYDEVPSAVKGDDRLTTYRTIRAKYPETLNGQIELAQWCLKRNLSEQARAHLTKVLELNQDNQEARRLLGYRLVGINWLNESDIADAEAQAKKEMEAFRKWKPKLEKIRTNLERGKRQSDAARAELMAIRDPEAAVAIALVLCADGGDTALVGIEALKKLPGREPSVALTQLAFYLPWNPLGKSAAHALNSHNKYDYVPMLLSQMQTPIQSKAEIYQSFNNGTLLYRHVFYREGQDEHDLAVFDTPYQHMFIQRPPTDQEKQIPNDPIGRRAEESEGQVKKRYQTQDSHGKVPGRCHTEGSPARSSRGAI